MYYTFLYTMLLYYAYKPFIISVYIYYIISDLKNIKSELSIF
jgi:hypothetical protein